MIQEHLQFNLYDKLLIEKVILVPPMTMPGMFANEACFLYAVNGPPKIYSPSSEINLQMKEGVVMKCGTYLNEWLELQEGKTCEAIAVHFYPEVIKKIYDKELPNFIKETKAVKPVSIRKVKATALLSNYIDSLQFYFENPGLVSEELLKLKVKELILLLIKTDDSESIQKLFASLFTPSEYSFKDVIESKLYSNLSNENLAFLTNLSLSSFKREFKKVYNSSPAKYFKERKLLRAAELIQLTSRRIGDIAFECGFIENSHFTKCFQERFGCTPTEFRLNHSNK